MMHPLNLYLSFILFKITVFFLNLTPLIIIDYVKFKEKMVLFWTFYTEE